MTDTITVPLKSPLTVAGLTVTEVHFTPIAPETVAMWLKEAVRQLMAKAGPSLAVLAALDEADFAAACKALNLSIEFDATSET